MPARSSSGVTSARRDLGQPVACGQAAESGSGKPDVRPPRVELARIAGEVAQPQQAALRVAVRALAVLGREPLDLGVQLVGAAVEAGGPLDAASATAVAESLAAAACA